MSKAPRGYDGPVDLLSAAHVARRLSISVRTLWRLVRRGTLPQPVRYGRKLVRWRTTDIEEFVAAWPAGQPVPA